MAGAPWRGAPSSTAFMLKSPKAQVGRFRRSSSDVTFKLFARPHGGRSMSLFSPGLVIAAEFAGGTPLSYTGPPAVQLFDSRFVRQSGLKACGTRKIAG